jgi:Fe-S cluster biogenesis protein NfuA
VSWLGRLLESFAGEAPLAPPYGDPTRIAEAAGVIDEMRAMFRADGGDVHLVGVDGDIVVVRLQGACASCGASTVTLQQALEPRLRERLAWVEGVRSDA